MYGYGHHYHHIHHPHCCGLYYWHALPNNINTGTRNYLPQLKVRAHTSIISTTSRTVLTQEFGNPKNEAIDEVRYTFPLYDGVSVVGFTCHVDGRLIKGVVKEKEKARKDFKEAVAKGETAGLLEQLPDAADVFTTTIGNIPAKATVLIELVYLGELKHDAEVDGVRFTIPTAIAPRYGSTEFPLAPGAEGVFKESGIEITIDAKVAEGEFIRSIRSPSHPIEVYMGTTADNRDADPQHHIASASLSLGSAALDKDFVLQVVAKDTGTPKAVLETHPTIPGQRALMATLVPKFALPPGRPEVVFVCDRSGSMSGSKMTTTVEALKVFLKSLPVGVKFNICSFGSRHSFLFSKSQAYSQDSLDKAIQHVSGFSSNFGGTEMLKPIQATIEQRYKDLPLEILLLTDGEIFDQDSLFRYLNTEISEKKKPVRVFTLGIGNDVSHSLIEGVARAGNGFAQAVALGEKLDSKVVRMLKGALSPHISDYTLEVKYENEEREKEGEDDGFEIVERVSDSLDLKIDELKLSDKAASKTKKVISLFDTSVDLDKKDTPTDDPDGMGRYAHLPKIDTPNLLQAPSSIPPLFPFNRTTVYLLLSPFSPQKTPNSVVLRATSEHGPLELEIPVQILQAPGETIHQLAARKAVKELEEGRGWLSHANQGVGKSAKSLKSVYESRYDEMVEREAVRLGVQFQVGGKWCSFVALEGSQENVMDVEQYPVPPQLAQEASLGGRGGGVLMGATKAARKSAPSPVARLASASKSLFGGQSLASAMPSSHQQQQQLQGQNAAPIPQFYGAPSAFSQSSTPSAFGQTDSTASLAAAGPACGGPSRSTTSAFGAASVTQSYPPLPASQVPAQRKSRKPSNGRRSFNLFSKASAPPPAPAPALAASESVDGATLAQYQREMSDAASMPLADEDKDLEMHLDTGESEEFVARPRARQITKKAKLMSVRNPASIERGENYSFSSNAPAASKLSADPLSALISLQTFSGSFPFTSALFQVLGISEWQAQDLVARTGASKEVVATLLAVLYFERKLAAEKDSWELVVEKARGWVEVEGVEWSNVEGGVGTLV